MSMVKCATTLVTRGFERRLRSLVCCGALLLPGVRAMAQQVARVPMPAESPTLRRPVTLTLDRVALRQAIDSLAATAHITVVYQTDLVERASRVVSLHARQLPLSDAFAEILSGTRLRLVAFQEGQFSIVHGDPTPVNGGITGRVIDAKTKRPIPRASITLDETTKGVSTNDDGTYRLPDIPAGKHRITVRYLGYLRQTHAVTVTEDSTFHLDFSLEPVVNTLDQVVVTATGAQRIRELGHVVATLNADSLVKNAPITSVAELLTARIPGLEVVTSNGGMAGGEIVLRVRGQSTTVLDPQPIVIIDGVRYKNTNTVPNGGTGSSDGVAEDRRPFGAEQRSPLNDLNVNDIETLELVKGPSASTLYGPDAANGVLVITTKRAKGGKTEWHVYAHPRLSDISRTQSIVPERGYWAWGHDPNTLQTVNYSCTLIDQYQYNSCIQDSITAAPSVTTLPDLSVVAKNRPTWQYGANVSGGSEALRYFLSGGYDSQIGSLQIPPATAEILRRELGRSRLSDAIRNPNTQQLLTLHSNVNAAVNARTDLNIVTEYVQTRQRSISANIFTNLQGDYGIIKPGCSQSDPTNLCVSPDYTNGDAFLRTTEMQGRHITGALSGVHRPTPWATLTALVGADINNTVDRGVAPGSIISGENGAVQDFRRDNTGRNADLQALAVAHPGRFTFRTALGTQYNYTHQDGIDVSGFGLAPGSSSISTARTVRTAQTWTERVGLGVYGEETIGINDRLFLNGGLRVDGSTSFGDAYHPVPYPKLGVSWILSEEPFMPRLAGLDELRLRVAVGSASSYPTSKMKLGAINNGQIQTSTGDTQNTYGRDELANPILKPERSRETEYGFDATFFARRLDIGFTGNTKRTNDMLQEILYALSVPPQWTNIGDVSAHGTEITANARLLDGGSITASLGFTYSYHTSKLLRLAQGFGKRNGQLGYGVGYPLGATFDTRVKAVLDTVGGGPDGIVFPEELVYDTVQYIGQFFPPTTYSLTPGITLRNGRVRVSTSFDRQTGFVVNNGGLRQNSTLVLLKRGYPLMEQAKYLTSSGAYEPGDFTRWREFTVSVDMPQRLVHTARFSRGVINFGVRNLALWTRYSGADPESTPGAGTVASSYTVSGATGIPLPRSWSISFDITP